MSMDFAEVCRKTCAADWQSALQHPFVQALAAGSLSHAQISTYLEQDMLYLVSYVRVCRTLARRSENDADRDLFERSAILSEEAEAGMQSSLCSALGIELKPAVALPATTDYMRHEFESAEKGNLLVALAAASPCNLLYAEIGWMLQTDPVAQSPAHPYRAWLDLYADSSVQQLAREWMDTLNRLALASTSPVQELAKQAFALSTRFETAFWQQAWHAG